MLGAAGVVLGALGAHALADRLPPERLAIWDTAVRYQLVHAVLLVLIGLAGDTRLGRERAPALRVAGWALVAGILMFSGSLYWLLLDGPAWLGPVTPVGGIALLAGWLALASVGCAGRGRYQRGGASSGEP